MNRAQFGMFMTYELLRIKSSFTTLALGDLVVIVDTMSGRTLLAVVLTIKELEYSDGDKDHEALVFWSEQ
jgi:hypothetical protein